VKLPKNLRSGFMQEGRGGISLRAVAGRGDSVISEMEEYAAEHQRANYRARSGAHAVFAGADLRGEAHL